MSNLSGQSTANHNDDQDDSLSNSLSPSASHGKISNINSRITSSYVMKRQQTMETKIANNQAYDEVHDVQTKHSYANKTSHDDRRTTSSSNVDSSHDLMQGNYYDQNRYDPNHASTSKPTAERGLIQIDVEDYKKTIAPVSQSKKNSSQTSTHSPPFGETTESIQQGIAQSAGILLELNKKSIDPSNHSDRLMKKTQKTHERAVIDYFPKDSNDNDDDDDDDNNDDVEEDNEHQATKQRSTSASPTSNDSTSESSTSSNNARCGKKSDSESTIPYEKLLNDEDEDDDDNELPLPQQDQEQQHQLPSPVEQREKALTEATTLLNKNPSQTYGTQSTTTAVSCERSKYIQNNGYNSYGSSITTKSSSDNSGSIRTNSGSDNDEESDEEHYNNSTASNHPHSMSTHHRPNESSSKLSSKSHDHRYAENIIYSNEQSNYRSSTTPTHLDQVNNHDEQHLQLPRFKQNLSDDSNDPTNKKDNEILDYSSMSHTAKRPSQSSGTNQSSSSHQHRNLFEHQDQTSTRQTSLRATKKRKQSQQKEVIKTELIPGFRGDRDLDELVMFIDGTSSKQQRCNSNETRTNAKVNLSNADANSNKGTSRKKSRKTSKTSQLPRSSSVDQEENSAQFNDSATTIDTISKSNINHVSTNDQINQSKKEQNEEILQQDRPSKDNDSSRSTKPMQNTSTNDTNKTKCNASSSSWFERPEQTLKEKNNDNDDDLDQPSAVTNKITSNLNSAVVSEPFVTVTHRRRTVKERRQETNHSSTQGSRYSGNLVTSSTSNSMVHNDKRRYPSIPQHEPTRLSPRTSLSNIKATVSSPFKEETTNAVASTSVNVQDSSMEKAQSSPRLSSHSSTSSLSSLLKRPSKPPPVVFMNKSINVELEDVSFGFDIDSVTINQSMDPNNGNSPTNSTGNKKEYIHINNTSTNTAAFAPTAPVTPSHEEFISSNDISNIQTVSQNLTERSYPQRISRDPQFYSGSDIRPQHRPFPTATIPPASSGYMDPLLLLQYNQSRFPSYPHPYAYMNFMRPPYLPSQPQYVIVPANTYPTTTTTATTATTTTTTHSDSDERSHDDSTTQVSEPIQEPLVVYTPVANPSGPLYYHTSAGKNSVIDLKQPVSSLPGVYPTSVYFPRLPSTSHVFPSSTAYFQPIPSSSSSSLYVETKIDEQDIDHDNYQCTKSGKSYPSSDQLPSTSSDIMSNALQLVYSQQRRNAQTDRFNLDDLTAYLAMKWTETVNHYEQGDSRILLVDHHE